MYWLRAKFAINSRADLEFLARLYAGVRGEATMAILGDKIEVEWQENPFRALLGVAPSAADLRGEINCRLCGPDTVRAVAATPDRLPTLELAAHPNRDAIASWAGFIDEVVGDEMTREGGPARMYESPRAALASAAELLLAIRASRHGTHVVPTAEGCIVSNARAAYLSYFTLHDAESTAAMFDKDDGFCNAPEGANAAFARWRAADCSGDLRDYYRFE